MAKNKEASQVPAIIAPPDDKEQAASRADEINEGLEYAQTVLPVGTMELGAKVDTLLREISGKQIAEPGDDNQFYTIDDNYKKGDLISLFKHVKFKEIPDTADVLSYFDWLNEDPHMSQEQYFTYQKQYRSKSYETLIEHLEQEKPLTLSGYFYDKNAEILEQVMNSSAAWHLAKRGAADSEQVKERWTDLYMAANNASETDDTIFDWVVQNVLNEKISINSIMNTVDNEIRLSLQGKKSRRIK